TRRDCSARPFYPKARRLTARLDCHAPNCGRRMGTEQTKMSAMIIRNGRVIDPANKRDEVADLYITDGNIVASKSEIRNQKSKIDEIDASNLIVAPGLIDMHVHLREPGFGHKETIASGARAAAAGGFTTIVC